MITNVVSVAEMMAMTMMLAAMATAVVIIQTMTVATRRMTTMPETTVWLR